MSGWNGSGVFTFPYNWENDAANGINIRADRMDTQFFIISTNGFANTLTRDGQGFATANLPMNGFKHTGAANGSSSGDYATYNQAAILANGNTFTGNNTFQGTQTFDGNTGATPSVFIENTGGGTTGNISVGISTTANDLISGSLQNDVVIYTGNAVDISLNGGTTLHSQWTTSGFTFDLPLIAKSAANNLTTITGGSIVAAAPNASAFGSLQLLQTGVAHWDITGRLSDSSYTISFNGTTLFEIGSGGIVKLDAAGYSTTGFLSVVSGIVTNNGYKATRQLLYPSAALTDAATVTWDVSVAQEATLTIAGNRTLALPTNLQAGESYALTVTQGAGGSHTLGYAAGYLSQGGASLPTLSTAAGAKDLLTFFCPDGSNMVFMGIIKAFA